jgi:hypothetical protein
MFSTDGGGSWHVIDLDPTLLQVCAIINSSSDLPLVLATDGALWRGPATGIEEWKNWSRLGQSPNEYAGGGIAVGDTIHVYAGREIWCSFNGGTGWTKATFPEPMGVFSEFTISGATCWGVTQFGEIFSTPVATKDWKQSRAEYGNSFPTFAWSIASLGDHRFIFEGTQEDSGISGWRCWDVDSSGHVKKLDKVSGWCGGRVLVDALDRVWVACGSLYLFDGNQWVCKGP